MRAHRAKSAHLPPSIFRLHFWLDTPSPYSAGWRWGLLSRKIFYFFLNPLSTRSNYTSIFIFFQILARIHRMPGLRIFFLFSRFSHSISTRILFFYFSDFRLVYPILGFQLNSFTEYLRFNLFIFARYYLDYDSWLRFWISTRFSSHQFRLVSALSILLFCLL